MYNTYRTFTRLANENLDLDNFNNYLIYQETQRPDILATYYCKYFNSIVFWHKKYGLQDESQTASISLDCLDYCLKNYNGKSSFKTYFNNGLRRRLLSQKQYELGKKRCANLVNIDDVSNLVLHVDEEIENFELLDVIYNSNLTEEQIKYCEYYLSVDKACDTDFCKIFGISRASFKVLKSSLKNKFARIY